MFQPQHNVLSKSQIGFLPNHCTMDHIYTLHTIILFACFICLKKVFDSIWHEGLYFIIKVQNKNWQQKKWILPSRTRDEPGLQFESNFVQYLYKWITGAICNTWAHAPGHGGSIPGSTQLTWCWCHHLNTGHSSTWTLSSRAIHQNRPGPDSAFGPIQSYKLPKITQTAGNQAPSKSR